MKKVTESRITYVFYAIISGALLGSISTLATSTSNFEISTSSLLFWRFLFASFVLLPFILNNSSISIDRKSIAYLLITGIVLYGPAIFFYFLSIDHSSVITSVILYGALLVIVSIISKLVSQGNISVKTIVEIAALLFGLYLIYAHNQSTKNILILICGTILYTIALLTNKKLSYNISAAYITFITCLGVGLFFLGISLLNKNFMFPSNSTSFLSIAFLGVFCTAIPLTLIIKSLKHISTLKLSALILIEPIISMCLKISNISNQANLKQSVATVAILLTILVHKSALQKKQKEK